MTYKQKLESQISFAEKKRASYPLREHIVEQSKWDGYIQGLRYALATLADTDAPAACQCSPTDLQPFGECVCGNSKVAPV